MEGFTIVDGVVALVVALSAFLAYSRGFLREVLAIAGWVVAAVLAFNLAPQIEPMVGEAPVVGAFIAESCEFSTIAAFLTVFAATLITVSLIAPSFSSLLRHSALDRIDQGLGFLFGAARGALLAALAWFVYETVTPAQSLRIVESSRSARVFAQLTAQVEDGAPEQALGWIAWRYGELVGVCADPRRFSETLAKTPERTVMNREIVT